VARCAVVRGGGEGTVAGPQPRTIERARERLQVRQSDGMPLDPERQRKKAA
jgi:hypothetical protein